jgi:guanylate kinase
MKTLVITGASALGKTYLADQLMIKYPTLFDQAKIYATRQPRKNQVATDRIFITKHEFDQRADNGEFVLQGVYGGNKYSYPPTAVYPSATKHLLVNVWPAMAPEFLKMDHIVLVALQTTTGNLDLLKNRMQNRGDTPQTIADRMQLIVKDIAIIEDLKQHIQQNGAVFYIDNDQNIPNQVLPWIVQKLGL